MVVYNEIQTIRTQCILIFVKIFFTNLLCNAYACDFLKMRQRTSDACRYDGLKVEVREGKRAGVREEAG